MIIFSLSIDLLELLQGYVNIAYTFYIHVYSSLYLFPLIRDFHILFFMAYTHSYFSAFQTVILFKIL